MIYLLDANCCIKFLNGRSENVRSRLESKLPEEVVLCSVVKAELLYGALKSARPAENLDRLGSFFRKFISLPFDDASSETYGAIRVGLERAGTPIGPNDLLIAAIARSRGATLVSNNTREFRRVEGLLLEDWE